jgi:hypothetical protein
MVSLCPSAQGFRRLSHPEKQLHQFVKDMTDKPAFELFFIALVAWHGRYALVLESRCERAAVFHDNPDFIKE